MKFGIIKERKNPPDKRVVLPPNACESLLKTFPEMEIIVESSDNRTFSDDAYSKIGLEVTNNVNDCDVMLGVKEVPEDALIPNKKYFFFSHTIKEQPYNQNLLKIVLAKNIELYDRSLWVL